MKATPADRHGLRGCKHVYPKGKRHPRCVHCGGWKR